MTALSDTPEIRELRDRLSRHKDDYDAAADLFSHYLESRCLERFVARALKAVASDPSHVVQNCVGQVNLTAINDRDFDLTIRLSPPFARTPHSVKWLGHRQILAAAGPLSATVRILRVPDGTDINDFRRGVELSTVREAELGAGRLVRASNTFEILDVVEARSTTVIHSLTLKNAAADLHWSFDRTLRSAFAEAARVTTSRVQTVMDVAQAMGVAIPAPVYETIFRTDDPHLRLFAIRQLLRAGKAEGFARLHEAVESDDALLRRGARAILNALASSAGDRRPHHGHGD